MFQLQLGAISAQNLLKHNHTLLKEIKKPTSRAMFFTADEALLTLSFSPLSSSGNAHFGCEIQLLKTLMYLQLFSSDRGLGNLLNE